MNVCQKITCTMHSSIYKKKRSSDYTHLTVTTFREEGENVGLGSFNMLSVRDDNAHNTLRHTSVEIELE